MRIQLTRFVYCLLFSAALLAMPAASSAQVSFGVSITVAPPEIPVYDQPECPGDDYIWVPGYWSWGDDDYYWVPGTWVIAPQVGYLWTPGYWGWGGSSFLFYDGYWGPQVGFYGGVNYGFGYFGHGYEGGRWDHDHFFYNRSVNNVNVTVIHNVYNTTVVDRGRSRVSYNGGNGGVNERPTPQEESATRERHIPPVAAQVQHVQAARSETQLRASVNHGKPPVAATPRPGEFGGAAATNDRGSAPRNDRGALSPNARGAVDQPGGRDNTSNSRPAIHPKDLPPPAPMTPPNTGNQKMDQKYQQQQQQLSTRQDQDRQRLQQKQDQEHQRMTQQNANEARQQQVEQKHQAQTQQLMQRHTQQQQQMQQRQQPRGGAPKAEERKP